VLHVQDFHRQFGSNDQCLRHLFAMRFADIECIKCSRKNAYHRHSSKQCFTCNCGRSHIYPKKGTIFEGSAISLTKWFYAIFLMHQSPQDFTAKELEKRLKVTYPTAWRMAKRIREALPGIEERERCSGFDALLKRCFVAPVSK
jgi:transposase